MRRFLLLALLLSSTAQAAKIDVHPGGLADAARHASDGDELVLAPARFENESTTIDKRLTITGTPGKTLLAATQPLANGKAILILRGDVTVRGITFDGAQVADRNGAGIRVERGASLDVSNSVFTNNQDGILAADGPGMVTVRGCTFRSNGAGDGYSHAIYVNHIARLTVANSQFLGTRVGHHVKSRAAVTRISDSKFEDGPNGTASYAVDLPNGGDATIANSEFRKAATSGNRAILHAGGEGTLQPNSILRLTGNRFDSARKNATALEAMQPVRVEASGNRFSGVPPIGPH
ncbi:right-handed parallel beta-helix repeat-containing protein [Roseiterribacter gracilis]|uniref:Right handed beta helix domain-containing protein n=1 Tax=Roseiterribacter gracilis TaxID=2812848 RepID=A0A8S8X980_9PROT|nr:hypothetical protein TMPK1_03360 [Rhodospirillales bacterium TMPK1]